MRDFVEEDCHGCGGAEGGGCVEGGGEREAVGYVVCEVRDQVQVGGEADRGGRRHHGTLSPWGALVFKGANDESSELMSS